ncbi:MAG: enoyl-CoA hydratase/isomerase family protein, partial [Armatimonadetes bacterium]
MTERTKGRQIMEYRNLDFWRDTDVGYVALDRPDHRNALSFDLLRELMAVADEISSSGLRTIVLTGNGTDFCAGFDLAGFEAGMLHESDPVQRYEAAQLGGAMAEAIESLPQITVAALHGNVIGGGVVLAAACDLRVADADTVF